MQTSSPLWLTDASGWSAIEIICQLVINPDYTHNPTPVGVLSEIACLRKPSTEPFLAQRKAITFRRLRGEDARRQKTPSKRSWAGVGLNDELTSTLRFNFAHC
jgi:hypothetical protein